MISSEELSSAVRGAWRLLNRDPAGVDDFNLSMEGLKNSFSAVLVVAPFYLFIVAASRDILPPPAGDPGISYLRELIALIVEWVLFLAGAVYAIRLLGLSRRVVPYVIAYNWSSLLIVSAMVPPTLLARYGIIGPGWFVIASLIITAAALYYRWFIARTVLGATAAIAALFVTGDIAINLVVQALIR